MIENWKNAPNVIILRFDLQFPILGFRCLKNKDKSNRCVCADDFKKKHL